MTLPRDKKIVKRLYVADDSVRLDSSRNPVVQQQLLDASFSRDIRGTSKGSDMLRFDKFG